MIQFVVGAAAGYVLGTKAGRKRYHQIKDATTKAVNSPVTKQVVRSTRKALADRLDPNPRMKEVKNLRRDKNGDQVLEPDED